MVRDLFYVLFIFLFLLIVFFFCLLFFPAVIWTLSLQENLPVCLSVGRILLRYNSKGQFYEKSVSCESVFVKIFFRISVIGQ